MSTSILRLNLFIYEDETWTEIEQWSHTIIIQTINNQYSISSVYLEMVYQLAYQIQIQSVSSYAFNTPTVDEFTHLFNILYFIPVWHSTQPHERTLE